MRDLIDLLEKAIGQYAPLYHFTTLDNIRYILEAGVIYGGSSGCGKVCVTRDREMLHTKRSCRIEIDANKVRQRFGIEPYDYHNPDRKVTGKGTRRAESEERIAGDVPVSMFASITFLKDTGPTLDILRAKDSEKRDRIKAEARRLGIIVIDETQISV